MDDFGYQLLQALILAFVPPLAVFAVGYLLRAGSSAWATFKAGEPDKAEALEWAVRTAIMAAEQAGAKNYFGDKKHYALSVAQNYLRMRGIKIDLVLVDAAIEAAVFEEFNRWKLESAETEPVETETV